MAKAGAKVKQLTLQEQKFAMLLSEGYASSEAARKAFGWKCDRYTAEEIKARYLSQSKRVKDYVSKLVERKTEQAILEDAVDSTTPTNWNNIEVYAHKHLKEIRDDPSKPARRRWEALQALEKLADPAQDMNLIWKYIQAVWAGFTAHCPCCHQDFPLAAIKNQRLEDQLKFEEKEPIPLILDTTDRRLNILDQGDRRRSPRSHPSQMRSIAAEERHVVALGKARAGKCHSAEDYLVLADGSKVKAKDLIGKKFSVLAFGPIGEQIKAEAFAVDNGLKRIYKVTTRSGRQVERTYNHPLLKAGRVLRGTGKQSIIDQPEWAEIDSLKVKDMIMVPLELNIESDISYDENDCKLLGYLLGDGNLVHNSCKFTQKEGPSKDEFRDLVRYFGCIPTDINDLTLNVKSSSRKHRTNHVRYKAIEWQIDCRCNFKKFPSWVWNLPRKGLALVLNRLYACDGWASTKGKQAEIGITLSSFEMIKDIQLAMLRLGINGQMREKVVVCANAKGGPKKCKAWNFTIYSKRDILKFSSEIGIYGKEEAVSKVVQTVNKRADKRDFRHVGCPTGYMWDEIISIDYLGELPSVAISVPYYETYLTTVVDHNSTNLGQFGFMHILMPGANIWILGRTYDDAKYEFEYIQSFLFTMFYPVEKHMYTVTFDKKTGDASIQTKWGAELTVKSGKAKGSITGQELDCMLVAEPGWVDADLFEEVRARMSSRLGRIFALGTPKGFGNFLGRMVKLSQRDMRTGKKLEPGSRLIKNGSPWAQSLLVFDFDAKDNPEYVLSELETARLELTEAEYASEFEGKMVVDHDKKFPFIKPHHISNITSEDVDYCSVVVGVDQGPRNFAALIVGWDGKKLYCIDEYFDGTGDNTMKANLIKVNNSVPNKLLKLRIPQDKWALTIFDADPPVGTQLEEMKVEGKEWKTEFTFRPKNDKEFMNWREETIQFINQLGKADSIVFCPATEILHEQLMEVIALPDDPRNELSSKTRKGWLVSDMWRGDHMLDALLLATWTIYQNMVLPQKRRPDSGNVWDQIQKDQEFDMQRREAQELKGFSQVRREDEIFQDVYGYEKPRSSSFTSGRGRNHYPDA